MAANELIAIELQLKGYEGVMSDFRALDQMLNGFRGRKNKIEIEADLAKTKRELLALKGAMTEFQEQQAQVKKGGTAWHILQGYIEETSAEMKSCRQRANELQLALKQISNLSFKQAFSKISSAVAHLGSAMQSAGNALTRLTNPFANFTKGMVMGAGYKALNKFTEGLNSGFNRYDTMKKYPKIMAAFGYSSEEAQKSIDKLDKSVRGLPTGLDEMVDLAQRFTATTGNIDKGTKLAIAANNAFLASMSTDTQKYQGMMQLQDVLGGKDMNAREWNSLVSSMTPAIVKMGESLGYTKKNMNEWIQQVRDGKVDNEKFIDTLIKIGNEGGVLEQMAQESKNTWQAFFANVGNAASRMTAGIIQSLDEISQMAVGKDVNQFLAENVIGGIDEMTASIKGWIKAHPDEILDFFKSLKQINFKSLIKGFGEGILEVANLVKKLADAFGGKDLSWIGRWMIKGNILGNFLTIAGGLLKGSRGIIGGVGASGYKLFRSIKGIKKYGFMGWLGKMMSVGEDAQAGEKAIETATQTAPKIGKFMTGLSKVFKGWGTIATMVGGTAAVGFISFKAFKSMLSDLKEMTDIASDIDWSMGAKILGGMTTFFGAFIGISELIGRMKGKLQLLEGGAILGGLSLIFSGAFWADMKLIKGGFKSIKEVTEYMGEALDNLKALTQINDVPQIKKNIQQAVAVFNAVTDLLQISRNNPITGEGTSGLNGLDKKSANTIKNVAESVKSMKEAVDTLNELGTTKMQLGGLSAVMAGMRNAFTQLSNLLIDMPSVFKDNTASSWANTMNGTMTNLKKVFDSLVGKNGILTMMPKLVREMSELTKGNVFVDLKPRMEQLGQTLKDVYSALQGIGAGEYFASNIDNFRNGLKSLKFAIKHLQEISGMEVDSSMVGKIQNIITNIKVAFDQGKITELTNTINTFKTAIEDALKSFEELNGDIEIDVKVKLNDGFDKSVKKVTKKISSAKGQIQSALNSVPSHFTKRITAHIIATAVVSGIGVVKNVAENAYQRAKAAATHNATGGRISRQGTLYRSKGGNIFKPRGTDKIPAMLTPGEYVHKKQAVDFFGVDFMRKVNNMDVRGAMNALLTKAGTSVGVGRQSIVNNTVNNNQRITQNISTNNPNFARARMGRFVGAL